MNILDATVKIFELMQTADFILHLVAIADK